VSQSSVEVAMTKTAARTVCSSSMQSYSCQPAALECQVEGCWIGVAALKTLGTHSDCLKHLTGCSSAAFAVEEGTRSCPRCIVLCPGCRFLDHIGGHLDSTSATTTDYKQLSHFKPEDVKCGDLGGWSSLSASTSAD